jgi:hypothetical protein
MSERLPETICWHCDRALDGASGIDGDDMIPTQGAVSLCIYCGAVALFGPDLRLIPPTDQQLDDLGRDDEFKTQYVRFMWARQYVMLRDSLMRDRSDPDR